MATFPQDPSIAAQLAQFNLENALYGQSQQQPGTSGPGLTWSQIMNLMPTTFPAAPQTQQQSLNDTSYQNFLDLLNSAGN
jgi:hypothetical protein